jgi:hypothetical protein
MIFLPLVLLLLLPLLLNPDVPPVKPAVDYISYPSLYIFRSSLAVAEVVDLLCMFLPQSAICPWTPMAGLSVIGYIIRLDLSLKFLFD